MNSPTCVAPAAKGKIVDAEPPISKSVFVSVVGMGGPTLLGSVSVPPSCPKPKSTLFSPAGVPNYPRIRHSSRLDLVWSPAPAAI